MRIRKRVVMKLTRMILVIMLFGGATFIVGCGDPEKPAGPGGERFQPFDRDSGQYK